MKPMGLWQTEKQLLKPSFAVTHFRAQSKAAPWKVLRLYVKEIAFYILEHWCEGQVSVEILNTL